MQIIKGGKGNLEIKGDPVIREKTLKVLGLPEDATPEEMTMAFLTSHKDNPANDHHRLTPELSQLFKDWEEYRKRIKKILPEKEREAA